MRKKIDYCQARDILIHKTTPVSAERAALSECMGRVLAEDLCSLESVPPFDRSAYDGYALIAEDIKEAKKEHPVCLKILEEVQAGAVPAKKVVPGTAVKILTGAQIPIGADTIVPFEKTKFTEKTVTLFEPVEKGKNIVRTGEDIGAGQLLAKKGTLIDAGLCGTLAAQGILEPLVYRIPKIGILSTGNEVVEVEGELPAGKIRNSNRYMFEAVMKALGFQTEYLGLAGDSVAEISELMSYGLKHCDAVISTGGVSVGDYDLTPAAMENTGMEIMIHGICIKPGMACAFGEKDGKLVYALSGNPASSLTSFYAVVLPSLRKLAGYQNHVQAEISVTMANDFAKESPRVRLLRGKLDLSNGTARIQIPSGQGNAGLSTMIGCDVMAIVPAGSGPVPAGTVLKGFLL